MSVGRGVVDAFTRLARRRRREPAQLPDGNGGTVRFTYADLVVSTLGAMYDPSSWPFLAEFLQELDSFTQPRRAEALRVRLGLNAEAPHEQVLEGFAGVWCVAADDPGHVSAWARAARAADRANPYFGRPWIWFGSICAAWPGQDTDRYAGPFDAETANPVLIIGNLNDPATRYEDAVSTAAIIPNSRLLTVAGSGHTSLFKSSCANRYVNRYLLSGQVPPRGAVCEVDVIPFSEPTSHVRSADVSPWPYLLVPTLTRSH